MTPLLAFILIAPLVAPLAGCGSGELEIVFLVPEGEGLSPLDEQISDVVIVRDDLGSAPQRTSHEITDRGKALEVGAIDPGNNIRIGVELRSATQRLVGFGRSDLLDIGAGTSAAVEVHLRRPYIYVTGDTSLAAFDSAKDSGDVTFVGAVAGVTSPQQVATSADGAEIIVVGGEVDATALTRISTSDHASTVGDAIPLTLPASDLVVSDDSRFALVAHSGVDGGVSVADLGGGSASFVGLGSVTRLAVTPSELGDQAFVVVDGGLDCNGPASSIVRFSLTEGEPVGSPITASGPVSSVAVLADGSLAAVLPCSGQVAHFGADGNDLGILAEVPGATAVTASGPRAVIIGTLPPDPVAGHRPLLVSVDMAGDADSDEPGQNESRVELPAVQVRVSTDAFSSPGDQVSRQLDPDEVTTVDIAAVPGGDTVAMLTLSTYSADGTDLVLPSLDLEVWEYTLIDTATGTPVQRVQTFCDLQEGGGLVGDWQCTLAPGQAATMQTFRPLGLAALYGGK